MEILILLFNILMGLAGKFALPLLNFFAPIIASVLEKTLPDLITKHWKWGHNKKRTFIKKYKKQSKKRK